MAEETSHLQNAIRISEHIEECLSVLHSSGEALHLTTGGGDTDASSGTSGLSLMWKKITFKLSSQSKIVDASHRKVVNTVVKAVQDLMLSCFNTYALDQTFALYEIGFELLVNIVILFENLQEAVARVTPNDKEEAASLLSSVKESILVALEALGDVYDALIRVIPTLEYLTPGVSGNLRLYQLEVLVELFGAQALTGRHLLELTNNDVPGCVGLIAFVIGHPGSPFQVQLAAATCLVHLTTADSVFLSEAEKEKNEKKEKKEKGAVQAKGGELDANDFSIDALSLRLHKHVNSLIQAIISFDVVDAFGRCICQHQMSHARTDLIVRCFLSTLHNCLLYCTECQKKLRQHLACHTPIIPDIVVPYIDNLLPALRDLATGAKSAQGTPADVYSEAVAHEISWAIESQNFRSALQTLVVATYNLKVLRGHLLKSGVISRVLDVPSLAGHPQTLSLIGRLLLNVEYSNAGNKDGQGTAKELTSKVMNIWTADRASFVGSGSGAAHSRLMKQQRRRRRKEEARLLKQRKAEAGADGASLKAPPRNPFDVPDVWSGPASGNGGGVEGVEREMKGEADGRGRDEEDEDVWLSAEEDTADADAETDDETLAEKEGKTATSGAAGGGVGSSSSSSAASAGAAATATAAAAGDSSASSSGDASSALPVCAMSGAQIREPVQSPDGHVFEKTQIETWLRQKQELSAFTNPAPADDDEKEAPGSSAATAGGSKKAQAEVRTVADELKEQSAAAPPPARACALSSLAGLPSLTPSKKGVPASVLFGGGQASEGGDSGGKERKASASSVYRSVVDAPEEYRCSLDGKLMTDPVVSPYGSVFERATIERWLETCGSVCPLTDRPLHPEDLRLDRDLKKTISDWIGTTQQSASKA
uniref:U-box domain-containing protein n=1 Tax=Chromera velia CCMP2878 TaxID=1169474 RepID=A0A0G4IDP7_9ALVE|eukprot:Cvel_13479.t1-p1 / transcript=Cvel_13479.t1 / gene=Cvel_13479 / organism=Chromera_velia_CCMP2878 / gene_product=U-box domain-containing protein 12, putative / transcript_product=U-box domain-containing protein 12, putative / location=Cvel_scaffold922:40404-46500(+) / protein_length=879 / sequence_SO=supercontig / SO=protein_coding / is_pseudo=false